MSPRTFFAACCLFALAAPAADVRGQARVWAGPGVDTNARRDFVSTNVPTSVDLFAFALGQAQGQAVWEKASLVGAYDIGARKFMLLGTEDNVIQSAQLEGALSLLRSISFGLTGRARDRRGAERDYTDLLGGLFVDFVPDNRLELRLTASAHRFLFYNRHTYSFFGPEYAASARYRFDRRWTLAVHGSFNPRTYNATANFNPAEQPPPAARTRQDSFVVAGASVSYRAGFQVLAGYTYLEQASNSFGESQRRHRLSVTTGFRLPAKSMLLVTGALQLAQYPDGVYLSPDLQVVEDDENSSALTVKVVRPLSERFDLDLRYAVYVNVLPQNAFLYVRHVGSLGVSASF